MPLPMGSRLNLSPTADRAEAAIAVFNLYRLLRAVRNLLPDYVLPVDMVQTSTHPRWLHAHIVSVLLCRLHPLPERAPDRGSTTVELQA